MPENQKEIRVSTDELTNFGEIFKTKSDELLQCRKTVVDALKDIDNNWQGRFTKDLKDKVGEIDKQMNNMSKKVRDFGEFMVHAAQEYIEADKSGMKLDRKLYPDTVDVIKNHLPDWAIKKYPGGAIYYNYYYAANGEEGYVSKQNTGSELSCTYYTLRRLRERGLGFPFKIPGKAMGGEWFDNCVDGVVPKYPGPNALQNIISNEKMPVDNVVVSYNNSQGGHVLLLDRIDANGNITFSDMTPPNIYDDFDHATNETKTLSLDEFLKMYKPESWGELNGAVIIG